MKTKKRIQRRLLALLAVCLLTWGIFCGGSLHAVHPIYAIHANEASEKRQSAAVLAADNGFTEADDGAANSANGNDEDGSDTGIAIPREIVLGIFAAAAAGGALFGYYFSRRKK